MNKKRNFLLTKLGLIAAVLPILIYAYEFGPEPRRTGAPGDAGTCLSGGCHTGTFNPASGSVKILTATPTYAPGVKQRIQVQITDPAKGKFGFQLTARLASNLANGQAGDFTSTDALTQTLCDDGSIKNNGSLCPPGTPVQFIEHTAAGYSASTAGGYTYQFDWTPPATNVGNVTLYVASVAGPAGPPVSTNANVYTANITLAPGAAPSGPTINAGGVVPVYSSSTAIQPGGWFSIYGSNLAPGVAEWKGDFPTLLSGTSVTVNGKPAYLWFVSPGQINAQAPDDSATGSVPVVVSSSAGSTTSTVTLASAAPSFLLVGDATHATGIIATPDGKGSQGGGSYDLLGPASFGAGFRAAKKGEAVAVYAVGLGPTDPVVPAGKPLSGGGAKSVTLPVVTLGGVAVTVDFAGIVGAGYYQINFNIPQNVGSGEQKLQATVNGVSTQADITIPIQ